MCRFALYLGPSIRLADLLTRPAHSLVHQARHSYEGAEEVNPDGWGVAWYVPHLAHVPALYKSVKPAWRSRALPLLGRAMQSRCVMAHVRAATGSTARSLENCHPFTWRGLSFMHNGCVEAFEVMRPALRERLSSDARAIVQGTTDSELLFARLTDHWTASAAPTPLARLREAARRTLLEVGDLRRACGVRAPSYLNFAVTDGEHAVVTRAMSGPGGPSRSLYVRTGARAADDGRDAPAPFVVVASEPLSPHGWRPVPGGSLVLVDADRAVSVEPVRARSQRRVA